MPTDVPGGAPAAPALALLERGLAEKRLTPEAGKNIRRWLSEPRYAAYVPEILKHLEAGRWQALDDVFWTIIPFGTGGRRGKMYPIGSNAINDVTIGESAQGLADYIRRELAGQKHSCAIAYDTRHRSRHFAQLCAEVMVANGFRVHFLDGYRSTPACSLAVRHTGSTCGLMITASHNPPSDNAVKVYWTGGVQILPPHDRGVIDCVMNVQEIRRVPFETAVAAGDIVYCQNEIDAVYQQSLLAQSTPGPRDLKIIYSPMHGVGAVAIRPMLAEAGFQQVEVFAPHATADGDFPNVVGHVANPENPATFDPMIARAKEVGADLVLSTDPDADRLGCAAPKKLGGSDWGTFTGNQIGALLADFVLESRKARLTPEHYVAKTVVTTEMIRRIADSYGVRTYGDLLVGFKWIGQLIDQVGPAGFLLGTEESHGFQIGTYVRDKDAAVAALVLSELAAAAKAKGQSLHERLDALYWQHGAHAERTVSKTMPGSAGMAQMRLLMERLRTAGPTTLAGLRVRHIRDYERQVLHLPGGKQQPFDCPQGDMVIFDLEAEGNCAAIRPSGTEPKVKFYLFAYEPAEQLANLDDTKRELAERLSGIERDLMAFADSIGDATN